MENYSDLIENTVNDQSLLILAIGSMVFLALLLIIYLISYIKIFKKAGKPGWAIFVPVYNYIVMLQIAKMSLINIILSLIPIVNIFIMFKLNINIAKRFGKGTGFGIGLTLFSIIFVPLLAFSDSVVVDNGEENNSVNNNDNASATSLNTTNNGVENIQFQNDIPVQNNIEMLNVESEPNIFNNQANMATPVQNNINNVSEEPILPNIVAEPNAFNSQTNIDALVQTSINNINEEPVMPNIMPEPNAFNSQANIDVPVQNNINNVNEEPVIPNIVPEPSAFNSQANIDVPVQNNINNVNEEPVMPNIVPEPNAFNSQANVDAPVQNNINNTNNVNEGPVSDIKLESNDNIILNNTQHSEILETSDKKICSKCGLEIPSIVTVCPKCGTEND